MITLTTEQAQQIEEALELFMDNVESPPEKNCSCHISPPCSDCFNYSGLREALTVGPQALATIRAARAQELNLNCKSVQKRLATQWGYVKADQAEQEPLMDYERINALREGEQNGAEDAYFFVRPENDTPTLRKMFCQGFERGFHKGLKYAAPVSAKREWVDLSNDEIDELIRKWHSPDMGLLDFAWAAIAAFKEKNK